MKYNEPCFHVDYATKFAAKILGLDEFSKWRLKRMDFNGSSEILLQFISSSANFLLT